MDSGNFEITSTGPLTIKNAHTGEVLWIGAGKIEQPTSSSVAIDEYDALMRRLYLKLHRKLWNWIADETERTHKCVSKRDAFKHFGWGLWIPGDCWACQYMHWKRKYSSLSENCNKHCLISWGTSGHTGNELFCVNDGIFDVSVYECWSGYYRDGDWIGASQMARIIANMPERKD